MASRHRLREVRVFVSSTFRDTQGERDQLVKRAFPELRARCRMRGITFTEVDLRWGVTRESAARGDTLQVCLDEIDRCRPYFVGILGDRYGWIPRRADIRHREALFSRFPWLGRAVDAGKSLVELEILHGALNHPARAHRALFYFRAPLVHLNDAGDAEKLQQLRQAIRRSDLPLRETYPDAGTLAQWVLEDLWRAIQSDFADDEADLPGEELALHDSFAHARRQAYVVNHEHLAHLDAYVRDGGRPLVISGEAGVGKSSLLAYWAEDYRRKHREALVLARFIGASSSSEDLTDLIRRIMIDIKERYDLPDEIPETAEQIQQEFPLWLARTGPDRVILIIDALDQLESEAHSLSWLPSHIAAHVRMIVSTLAGPVLDVLRERDWAELAIGPLKAAERNKVIDLFLASFSKRLSPPQRRRLLENSWCANPLFLRTVLEELRLFGRFEELDAQIDYYLSASNLAHLFQRVLARLEQDYGAKLVESFSSLLCATRRGLAEVELIELLDCSRLDLSALLLAIELHLVRRNGLFNFFHRYVREAVESRYLQDPSNRERIHLRLADFFEVQPMTVRRLDEVPWQLRAAKQWLRLKDQISDLTIFELLGGERREFELIGYWMSLRDSFDPADVYAEVLARFERTAPEKKRLSLIVDKLGGFFDLTGRWDVAEPYYQRGLQLHEVVFGPESAEVAESLCNVGLMRELKGAYDEAEQLMRRGLAIREKVLGSGHRDVAHSLHNLSTLLTHIGDYKEAEALSRRALEILTRTYGSEHPLVATVLDMLGFLLIKRSAWDAAEPVLRRALAMWERLYGPDHSETTYAMHNLGWSLVNKGEYDKAELLLRRALSIKIESLGATHPSLARLLAEIGYIHIQRNELADAKLLLQQSLDVARQAFGEVHPATARGLQFLGLCLYKQGSTPEAYRCLSEAVSILEQVVGPAHPDTIEVKRTLEAYHAANVGMS